MSVTAARLGSSPIALDWTDLGARSIDVPAALAAWEKFRARVRAGQVSFFDAPSDPSLSQIDACEKLARECEGFSDCLFIGIGGSSLGPKTLLSALIEKSTRPMRLHFAENPDPLEWKHLVADLDPARTLVCIVAKSGSTFETLAQSLLALRWIGEARWRTQVVAITDPEKGDLRKWARDAGVRTLEIAPSIGGRFAVFTPVGLFAAALKGLDVRAFLAGAASVRDSFEKAGDRLGRHPLLVIGEALLAHKASHATHVCMPYSTRLKSLGEWFVQLWGESLGKDGKGFTPVGALGAVDQHSLLQLLRDGPNDKITWFLSIDAVADEVRIPRLYESPVKSSPESFRILEGHSLHELLTVEYRAIARVLTKAGRPHFSWRLDRLDEKSVGALMFALACLTAYVGTRWELDPFDQPGVEEGKVYIREQLQAGAAEFSRAEEDENSPVNRLRRHRETTGNES